MGGVKKSSYCLKYDINCSIFIQSHSLWAMLIHNTHSIKIYVRCTHSHNHQTNILAHTNTHRTQSNARRTQNRDKNTDRTHVQAHKHHTTWTILHSNRTKHTHEAGCKQEPYRAENTFQQKHQAQYCILEATSWSNLFNTHITTATTHHQQHPPSSVTPEKHYFTHIQNNATTQTTFESTPSDLFSLISLFFLNFFFTFPHL